MVNNLTPISLTGNNSVVSPGPTVVPAGGFNLLAFISTLISLAPFIAFFFVIWWGTQKKNRKKTAIEWSYNLIILQLLFDVLLPISGFEMGMWVLTLLMFAVLVGFMYHRKMRDTEHRAVIQRAIDEGNLQQTGVLQGQLEHEMRRANEKPIHEVMVRKAVHHVKRKLKKGKNAPVHHEQAKPDQSKPDHSKPKMEPPPQPTRKHWLAKYAEGLAREQKFASAKKESPVVDSRISSVASSPVARYVPTPEHKPIQSSELRPVPSPERSPTSLQEQKPSSTIGQRDQIAKDFQAVASKEQNKEQQMKWWMRHTELQKELRTGSPAVLRDLPKETLLEPSRTRPPHETERRAIDNLVKSVLEKNKKGPEEPKPES